MDALSPIDLVVFIFGNMAIGIEPALKQAGLDVQIGGILPSAPNLAALKNGDNSFWVGLPPETSALVALDSALRVQWSCRGSRAEVLLPPGAPRGPVYL